MVPAWNHNIQIYAVLPGAGSEAEEKPKVTGDRGQTGQHEVSVSVFEGSHCEPEKLKASHRRCCA